jgi:hypothetical protein
MRKSGLQAALAPGSALLLSISVEATDCADALSYSHQDFGHVPHLVGTRASDEHLGQSRRHLRNVSAVALEYLGVKLAFTITGTVRSSSLPEGVTRSRW